MQIQLSQSELEAAVRDYVRKSGITRPVGDINFTATRGDNPGIQTTIDISEVGVELSEAKVAISTDAGALSGVTSISGPQQDDDVANNTETDGEEESSDNESLFG